MKKKVIIVSSSYPSPEVPHVGIFVKNIAEGWVEMGSEVVVICPKSIFTSKKIFFESFFLKPYKTEKGIIIIRPPFFNISKLFFCNIILQNNITQFLFELSCSWGLKYISFRPDFVYCHFLITVQGAYKVANTLKTFLFVGCGESDIGNAIDKLTTTGKKIVVESLSGIISNSPVISEKLYLEGLINKASLLTVPNRADPIKFFPIDLKEARRKKKIDISDFVLIFVGQFIPRKGYKQVLEAIKLIPNIKIIFIGKGTPPQISEQIIFAGSVSHEELPQWLACANIFVLPTTGEGCSNAISEAMAMGLPIISSNLPEISCQVFPDSSILVDPMSIDEIVKGINLIKDNYDEFQSKAIKNAHSLPKEKRAEIIGKWIVEEISKEEKN